MPSVTDSILGTLGALGGMEAQRTREGLEATQAHGLALGNKKAQLALDREEERMTFAEMDKLGIVRENKATGSFDIDYDKLIDSPDLAVRVLGPEANKFLSTKTANGSEKIKLGSIKKVPGGLIPNMNPVQESSTGLGEITAAPTGPASQIADKYMVELEKADGTRVPATESASADPNDKLVTLDRDQIKEMLDKRIARMVAGGAADNAETMGRLNMEFTKHSDAYMQSLLADEPEAITGGDPVAGREFYAGVFNNLSGEDLDDAIRAKGLDPEKIRAEAAEDWAKRQGAARSKAAQAAVGLTPGDHAAVQSVLSRSVAEAEKALADHDKANAKVRHPGAKPASKIGVVDKRSKEVIELEKKFGPQMKENDLRGYDPNNRVVDRDPAADATRAALVKNLESAKKTLGDMKPAAEPAKFQSGYEPKFEFTEQNMRDAVVGKLTAASAEESAKVAQYARDQGVKKAADLAKLSYNDAMALATIIAANTQGDSTKKLEVFEKLTNFARTGDTAKSPIDASGVVQKGIVDQTNAATSSRAVDASIDNSIRDYNLGIGNLEAKWAELTATAQKAGYDKAETYGKAAKDIYNEYTAVVRNGAMGKDPANPQSGDVTIKNTGPTAEMNTAMNGLRNLMSTSPKGSPQYVAAASQYLDALGAYAASVAAFTGRPAGWDLEKQFVNFFFREAATMPVGSMMENLQFDTTPNGEVVKFRALESGPGSKRTEVIAGADTIDRFLGAGTFEFLKQALAVQAELNAVKKGS